MRRTVRSAFVTGLLLTAAAFRIDKANTYNRNNGNGTMTALQDGREVHTGVEITASGKLADRLTIIGGLPLVHARVEKAAIFQILPAAKRVPGQADQRQQSTTERNLPRLGPDA